MSKEVNLLQEALHGMEEDKVSGNGTLIKILFCAVLLPYLNHDALMLVEQFEDCSLRYLCCCCQF